MTKTYSFTLNSRSPEQTKDTASLLADILPTAQVIALNGELGSGKTCFVQGLARALARDADAVSSPTFTYVNEYKTIDNGPVLAHMDMYRVNSADDIINFNPGDYFDNSRISAVEWAERIDGILPHDTLHIDFTVTGLTERQLVFSSDEQRIIKTIETTLGK